MLSLINTENFTKYLKGFTRYGDLNYDISKYGHLKVICLYVYLPIQSSKYDDIQS